MLPFLRNKSNQSTGIVTKLERPADDTTLEECASKMIEAINTNDIKSLAEAMKQAFKHLESLPHAEGPHTEE